MTQKEKNKIIEAYDRLHQSPNVKLDDFSGYGVRISEEDYYWLEPFFKSWQKITTRINNHDFISDRSLWWGETRITIEGKEFLYVCLGDEENHPYTLFYIGYAIRQVMISNPKWSDLKKEVTNG